ncbi:MAG TPA: class I SAM-dependent methyltransferase [Acidimicrobiales bacterium]|jgi:SAM-dependent methyltransferase|nr:class I SAM-dependent methyltransferase [Acidimicrobiales bacterium]
MPEPETESTPLSPETKAARAGSFGGAASLYERYRPGPPTAAVDWVLPERVRMVVDLGAGTGALTRLLVGRAEEVVAVEPDDRMRAVVAEAVPGARAVAGRGEAIPLPDGSVDAVLASSSWHWMDTVPTLLEVARVLVPGGTLAAMWSGPDPDSGLIAQAQALLRGEGAGDAAGAGIDAQSQAALSAAISDQNNLISALEIPTGAPFDQPEQTVITWDVALNADELIGLLGTFSWVILMEEEARERLFDTARRVLRDMLGVSGDVTVDIGYRADVFKARRQG